MDLLSAANAPTLARSPEYSRSQYQAVSGVQPTTANNRYWHVHLPVRDDSELQTKVLRVLKVGAGRHGWKQRCGVFPPAPSKRVKPLREAEFRAGPPRSNSGVDC